MIMCSACLLGDDCRYDGTSAAGDISQKLKGRGVLIPVCPEVLGGMDTPRKAAMLAGGSGYDVLDGKARVVEANGTDVTDSYLRGARIGLEQAQRLGISEAILYTAKGSPSCGCGKVWIDGKKAKGDGVFAALLKRNGINVISEEKL